MRAAWQRRAAGAGGRRSVARTVGWWWTIAASALLAACDVVGAPSAPRLRDQLASTPVRLSARAAIGQTTEATQVLVGAFYLTSPVSVGSIDDFDDLNEDVDGGFLGAAIADLTTARAQQVPVSVDLSPCLADTRVARSGGTCPVYVVALLLRGRNVYDPRDPEAILDMDANVMDVAVHGPFTVAPGATLAVPQALTLDEAQEVRATPSALALVVGQSAAVQASVVNAFGAPVPGRAVTWSSENPLVARVDAGGGVTGVAAGVTAVRAVSGNVETRVPVTVAAPRITLPADTTVAFTVARGGTTTGTSIAVGSSVGTAPLDLAPPQISYGPGATGWLAPTLVSPRTPATLLLTPVNTTTLAPGQYTAAVSLASTTPGVPRRTILVTLTVTGIAAVDCSRSQVAPYFPPATAERVAPSAPWYFGSTGQFFLAYNLGVAAQPVTVQWDMYSVPDAITVCFRGRAVYDSGTPVSGSGQFVFQYPGSAGLDPRDPAQSVYLYLSVRAEDVGTSWQTRVLGTYVAPSFPVPGPFALRTPAEIARLMAADRAAAAPAAP